MLNVFQLQNPEALLSSGEKENKKKKEKTKN